MVTMARALLLSAPLAASAQTQNLQTRAERLPTGMSVPNTSVAGAEEPTALEVNPAGLGFVGGAAIQYFHEGRAGSDLANDGVWLAGRLGPLVPGLSMEFVRPGNSGEPHFRKTALALALGGHFASLGAAWNFYNSPDRDLEHLGSFDIGLTLRPWRALSVGASALGLSARLGDQRLPTRYDFGIATRLWRDNLTLSADLLTDDRGRGDLSANAVALGLGLEVGALLGMGPGLGIWVETQFPAQGGLTGPAGSTFIQMALTLNSTHAGVTAGYARGSGVDDTWLVGARLSTERYPGPDLGPPHLPEFDLAQALSQPSGFLLGGGGDAYGQLLRTIGEARDDDSVPALAIKIDSLPIGQGRIDELRELLFAVRKKKPVIAYLVGGGMREYHLATAASAVLAPQSAAFLANGTSSSSPFLREGLHKLGISFQVIAAGRYKSGGDPLVREDMSAADREARGAILDEIYSRQVREIAGARGLDPNRVRELIDRGLFSAEDALRARLIDGLAWPDELAARASALCGRRVELSDRLGRVPIRRARTWGPREAIALLRVEGFIASKESRAGPLALPVVGSDTVAKLVRQAAADQEVKAIVVRIDSGGGDALASDLICRELLQARRIGKPVVASMGDVAASGGYLLSVCADAIVAEPSTLTGSIGVLTIKPDLSGLLAKIGLNTVTLKRGEHADLETLTRPWSAQERALVERQVFAFYDLFLSRVAAGRQLSRESVERVAGGRVWTGKQALERALVDKIGSLDDAIQLAKAKAGLPPDAELELRPFERKQPLLAELARNLEVVQPDPLLGTITQLPGIRTLALLLEMGPLLAVPPSWVLDDESLSTSPRQAAPHQGAAPQ